MTLYSIVLFLHVVAAMGLFAALGIEWVLLVHLRRASSGEQARTWLTLFLRLRPLFGLSLAIILLAGLYMTIDVWGWDPWILVALGSMVMLGAIGGALTGTRMAAIGRAMGEGGGAVTASLRGRLRHPALLASLQLRTALVLGIVFLMTNKPGLVGTLVTIGVAVALGLAPTLAGIGRDRSPATS
jgi:hypothetical protein